MDKIKSIGIIFYEFINNNMIIHIKRNNLEYYEDIKISEDNDNYDISIIINKICAYCKIYNSNTNHMILLLNCKKYNDIYNNIIDNNKIEKISISWFNNKNVHKTIKHSRIKLLEINKCLDKIYFNHKLRFIN